MRNLIFYSLVIYYLFLNYFNVETVERFSMMYFLLTVPIALFVACFSIYLVTQFTVKTLILGIFLLLVIAISLFRADWWTMISAFFIFSTMIVVINSRVPLIMRFINAIFILAVVGSVISFHTGINEFGYIPRIQNIAAADVQGLGVRISLFPLTPESAFFSLLIIILNYYHNPSKSRYIYYALGAYFLIFSASRTAIAICVFFVAFEIIARFVRFQIRPFYYMLNFVFVLAFILMSNMKFLHLWIARSDNEVLKSIILRTQKDMTYSSDPYDVATRLWIWEQHFRILSNNPVFGVGTYEFGDYIPNKTKTYHFTTGSESFLTSWMARVGIVIALIVAFIIRCQNNALSTRNKRRYVMCLFFTMVLISYGSFVVPYNFLFLLMILALTSESNEDTKRRNNNAPLPPA